MLQILKKKFVFIDLTLADTIFYKGLAISIIIMHNFFHWLPPKIGENEQNFRVQRLDNYLNTFDNPEYIFQATFSFLGHYGVQMFLFLSAYGLTKKYLNSEIAYFDYLKKRILKIYPAFLFSIVIWVIYIGIMYGGVPHIIKTISANWQSLLYKLIFISNFIPGELYKINGPWWFVSLIVQFYIIFPLMISLFKKFGIIFLFLLSISSLVLTSVLQPHVGIPLPGTILMHIPELSLGIFLAQKNNFTINYLTILIIAILFVLSNQYHFFWYFSFASILILMLILFQIIIAKINIALKNGILFIGTISMYIFYINGFMRQPWIKNAKLYDLWYVNIMLCCVFVVLVVAISYLMGKISEISRNQKSA